jgi:hypothetical protein
MGVSAPGALPLLGTLTPIQLRLGDKSPSLRILPPSRGKGGRSLHRPDNPDTVVRGEPDTPDTVVSPNSPSPDPVEIRHPVERELEHQLAAARGPFERPFGIGQRLAGADHAP